MFRTKRFQLVELIVTATIVGNNQNVYFQNQPQLQSVLGDRTIYIKKIETYTNKALALSPLTSGNGVATPADIINGVLTLCVKGEEQLRQIPLADLNRVFADTGAAFAPFVWEGFYVKNLYEVDWTKSYVTLVATPAAAPFSYLFGVHYDYEPDAIDLIQQM
jgi:hypothetical protein